MSALSRDAFSMSDVVIRTPEDIRPAAEALCKIALALGNFRVAPCVNIASKRPMADADGQVLASSVFGWTAPDERWWERSRLALESPLPIACRYESEPFWCNASGIHPRRGNPHLDALDFSDFRQYVNGPAAIVIPVHLPFGQVGSISFVPIETDETGPRDDLSAEYETFADELAIYAHTFMSGYNKVMDEHDDIADGCLLSKREVECLRWAALGKTDFEISLILARSNATIRFHIHKAATKLKAVNRNQTVFKAAQLGYLGLMA